MIKNILERFKLRDQLSADLFKVFALIEKTLIAFTLIVLVFVFMERTGLTNGFMVGGVAGGTLGFLVMNAKKMYHDEALSELRINATIKPEILQDAMLAIGYSEKKEGVYSPRKKMFSIFYVCKSEIITHKAQDGSTVFTGPYDRLLGFSDTLLRSVSG